MLVEVIPILNGSRGWNSTDGDVFIAEEFSAQKLSRRTTEFPFLVVVPTFLQTSFLLAALAIPGRKTDSCTHSRVAAGNCQKLLARNFVAQ
jgi:hypothetical protein